MKVVLAGAYGNLGAEILKALLKAGHEVVAADMMERDLGVTGNFTFKKIDVTKPETLVGLCNGAGCVISTVGLTKTSAEVTNYLHYLVTTQYMQTLYLQKNSVHSS